MTSLSINFGTQENGTPFIYDLRTAKNILIAGAVGSGKDNLLNYSIASVVTKYSPKECEIVIIDPRGISYNEWATVPHLSCPIIRLDANPEHLQQQVEEIKQRQLNKNTKQRIIIITEVGEFIQYSPETTTSYLRFITEQGPKVGVYTIASTQWIDKTILTGEIQSFFTTRISLHAINKEKSILQLGMPGAENLKPCNEAIFYTPRIIPTYITIPYLSDDEIRDIVTKLRN